MTDASAGRHPVPADGLPAQERLLLELLVQARQGNTAAFDRLYDSTARWLLQLVRRIVSDGQAEDVLTEVYLQIWKTLHTYDETRSPPGAWLRIIAASRALDHVRREKVHGQRSRAGATQEADAEDLADGPEQLVLRAERCGLVRDSLRDTRLSSDERAVVGLAYFRESSHQEIADITGLPLGSVKTIMGRALHKLRIYVAAREVSCIPRPASEPLQ